MGLWRLITTPIFGGGHNPYLVWWREPTKVQMRLRYSPLLRSGTLAACVVVGATGMLLLTSALEPSLGPEIGLGLGTLLGAFVGFVAFARRNDAGGKVAARDTEIERKRLRGSLWGTLFGYFIYETQTWPYREIVQCRIVPHKATGQPFSVLVIGTDGSVDLIGIPRHFDLQALASHLQERGVAVSFGTSIPGIKRHKELLFSAQASLFVAVLCLELLLLVAFSDPADKPNAPQREQAKAIVEPQRPPGILDRTEWEEQRTELRKRAGTRPRFNFPRYQGNTLPFPKASSMVDPLARREPGAMSKDSSTLDSRPSREPNNRTASAATVPTSNYRTWSDTTRKYEVEAEMLSLQDDKVSLKKRDGKVVVVPLDQLCEADRAYAIATRRLDESTPLPKGAIQDSGLAGGKEGFPFRYEDQRPLLGIRYRLGGWNGEKTVGRIVPLFDRQSTGDSPTAVIAKDGYAVGALNVDARRFVNAMQLVFMRLTPDGHLNQSDSYTSDWIGFQTGRPIKTLGGTGATVVGVHGRHGAILDAVGLVMKGQ